MKNKFSEYYYLSEEQLKAIIENNGDDTLYVFDTNVFLSIYDASKKTAETTLEILEFVASHSWMPYQVGLEFHRNRINKFKSRKSLIEKFQKDLATSTIAIKTLFNHEVLFDQQLDPEIDSLVDTLCEKGEALLDEKLNEAKTLEKNDEYLARIESIYSDDKIGNPLNKQQYEVLQKTIEKQWEKKKGVGNKDAAEKINQYEIYPGNFMFCNAFGDPVIIEEIKNEVARRNQAEATLKNVVFVSNDQKSDFITVLANGQKVPQFYLQRYMCEKSDNYPVPLKHFIQVSLEEFIKHMNGKIDSLSENQISEAAYEIENMLTNAALFRKFDKITYKLAFLEEALKRNSGIEQLKLAVAVENLRELARIEEIHQFYEPNKSIDGIRWDYAQANRHLHWEDIDKSWIQYLFWVNRYGFDGIEAKLIEEAAKI